MEPCATKSPGGRRIAAIATAACASAAEAPVCGSPLFFEPPDDASWVEIEMHSFTASRIPWLDVRDDLPRSPGWRDPRRHKDKPQGY